jgi:hypothetical protein
MLLNSPRGAAHIRRVSPRWGSIEIIALRFYKYFAPLGLKSQLIFYKKYNNLRRDTIVGSGIKYQILAYLLLEARSADTSGRSPGRTRGATCERDSSGTTEPTKCEARGGEGDGADSPTRGAPTSAEGTPWKCAEAARPKY